MWQFIIGCIAACGALIASALFGAKIGRNQEAEKKEKEHEEYVQKRDEQEKKKNEQKESIETGNGTADFLNGIQLLHNGKGNSAE